MKIVLASNNKGKLREFNKLLAPLNIEVHPQGEFNIPAAEEPYGTFLENCLAKARHAARLTGLPAIADDSGICVNALGGAPGVHSARFAGEPGDDAKNNALLVEKLQGASDRGAHYTCAIVLTRPDGTCVEAEGRFYGEVTRVPAGENGFGYDPLFYLPQYGCTAAQLTPAEKNAVSHRAIALRGILAQLEK